MKKGYQAIPNQQLLEERLRHHWTQQEVASRIGTTSMNYSRWERGMRKSKRIYRKGWQ